MKAIELVTGLPNLQWSQNSRHEITVTGEQLLDLSDFVWRVGNVAVAGFIYTSYVNPPWMWFVLTEKITLGDLIDFRRLATQIPQGTLCAVAVDFAVGFKFAKFYGFEETGEEVDHSDRLYKVMRKI